MSKENEKHANMQMVEIDHNKFAVQLQNDNVSINLTQLSKPFGKSKRPVDWLKTDEACQYIDKLSEVNKCTSEDLIIVKKGGVPGNQGTWCTDYLIAMRFAQWLSPEFSIMVDKMLVKLLRGDAVLLEPFKGISPIIHNGKAWYNYLEVLIAFGYSHSSGTVSKRKTRFPQHFAKLYGRNFISLSFCQYLQRRSEIRQLELNFIEENKALEGGQS